MKIIFVYLFLLIGLGSCQYPENPTTLIIVRHAEKIIEESKDPGLTAEGKNRAKRLAALLSNTEISGTYSTAYTRTRETVGPTADMHDLKVVTYRTESHQQFLNQLLKDHEGSNVLIAGHSNTVPVMVNLLCNTDLPVFKEQEYGNIMIVTASSLGTGRLLRLNY